MSIIAEEEVTPDGGARAALARPIERQPRRSPVEVVVQNRGRIILGVLAGWVVLWLLLRGSNTLPLGPAQLTDLHRGLNDFNDSTVEPQLQLDLPLLFNEIRLVIDQFVVFIQSLIAQPSFRPPAAAHRWFGVVAWSVSCPTRSRTSRRAARCGGFFFLRLQGGGGKHGHAGLDAGRGDHLTADRHPVGIWPGSDRVNRIITPVLDLCRSCRRSSTWRADLDLPDRAASATIATLIYAVPPVIRLTATASARRRTTQSRRASRSGRQNPDADQGSAARAKRDDRAGVNQTIMAALANGHHRGPDRRARARQEQS